MYHSELLEREATTSRPLGFACSTQVVEVPAFNAPNVASGEMADNRKPRKGTWFDEGYDLREPEGGALCSRILSLIDECEVRTKALRQDDRYNRYILVRHIVANGLRCQHYYEPPIVAHSCRAAGYRGKPRWLSGRAFARTVSLMVKVGLLTTTGSTKGISSAYEMTDKLIALAGLCGVTIASLTYRTAPDRLVRLKNHQKREITYKPSQETEKWCSALIAFNAFVAKQDICLPLSEADAQAWVAGFNLNTTAKERPILRKPLLVGTDLRRVFNNSSFLQGGRLYGGWWIDTPERLRRNIVLNGQPVIELDYSGCAIRMLYHQRGIECEDDPYWLEPIANLEEATELSAGHFREAIKKLVQVAINDHEDGRGAWIPLPGGVSFDPHFTRSQVMEMIRQKHAPIADAFNSGAGLRLQREDSDLALAIITGLMDEGIVALPVHDSFIAAAAHEPELRRAMKELYQERFGYFPVIRQ